VGLTARAADDEPGQRVEGRPVIVGEILFDVFPDGEKVLGGAPLNVAWHLDAFGLNPLMVSRIGDDDLGNLALEILNAWGIDCSAVQIDPVAPTGRVAVELDRGVPRFDIVDDQAYDRLDGEIARGAVDGFRPALLYHGSLIARRRTTGRALQSLRKRLAAPVFVDVNLREPWWDREPIIELIRGARWVKLNDDELQQLSQQMFDSTGSGVATAAAELSRRHGVDEVIVTRGDRGALAWVGDRSVAGRALRDVEIVDTVGAGDAFSAVWIMGQLRAWSPETTLTRALDFAAAICGSRGATTADRGLYDRHLYAWRFA
jgi:fructokinase